MIIVHQIFYPKQEFMIPNQGIKQSHLFMLKIKYGVILSYNNNTLILALNLFFFYSLNWVKI